jgi:hypothetical protein
MGLAERETAETGMDDHRNNPEIPTGISTESAYLDCKMLRRR